MFMVLLSVLAMSDTIKAKMRVFLGTLSLENGDEDGSVAAAQDEFLNTYIDT